MKFENKLIVSDIDGTFFDDDMNIADRNIDAINYFKENGGHFTFATGRNEITIPPDVMKIANAPIVCCNGSYIYDPESERKMNEICLAPGPVISIINTVEYNEYRHGTREEAIIASIRPFFTKMASALVVVITSVSYMIFGVTNYTNQISDMESAAASGLVTEAQKLAGIENILSGVQASQSAGLLLCMVVLPYVLMFFSYLLYRKHYILDEAEYDRICQVIAERKQTV